MQDLSLSEREHVSGGNGTHPNTVRLDVFGNSP